MRVGHGRPQGFCDSFVASPIVSKLAFDIARLRRITLQKLYSPVRFRSTPPFPIATLLKSVDMVFY